MTSQEYIESIRKLKRKVYFMGEVVEDTTTHPYFAGSLAAVAKTYELAADERYKEIMTVKSHLTGNTINRFTHINHSPDDLIKKVKMLRLMGQETATCFQRCAGFDGMNATYSVTYDIDKKRGTQYHQRFKRFLQMVQEKDFVVDAAMTDPKGDRGLSPAKQTDPDQFLHIVERREDGIVVVGAKAHQTGALNSHHILVMPTLAMKEDEGDYAVMFSVPADAEGLVYIVGRQPSDLRSLDCSEPGDVDSGNYKFAGQEALIVFDHVFVPNEQVYMCGETEFSGLLVERFASYHRQSYGGCKVGVGDVVIGATATVAEYNGVEKASHVKDKLVQMTQLNEQMYGGAIAAAVEGSYLPCGSYWVDPLLANVTKLAVTENPYHISRLAQDIAGGVLVTLPAGKDFENPDIGHWVEKYAQAKSAIPAKDRARILRLLENLTLGRGAAGYLTESLHGAGSPQAQRIMIGRYGRYDLKKRMAKKLVDIKDNKD